MSFSLSVYLVWRNHPFPIWFWIVLCVSGTLFSSLSQRRTQTSTLALIFFTISSVSLPHFKLYFFLFFFTLHCSCCVSLVTKFLFQKGKKILKSIDFCTFQVSQISVSISTWTQWIVAPFSKLSILAIFSALKCIHWCNPREFAKCLSKERETKNKKKQWRAKKNF